MAASEVEAAKVVVNEDANNASDQPPTPGIVHLSICG